MKLAVIEAVQSGKSPGSNLGHITSQDLADLWASGLPRGNNLTKYFLCDPRYHALIETAAMFGSYCLCRYDTKASALYIGVTMKAIKVKAWSKRYGCPQILWRSQAITKMIKGGNQGLVDLIYESGSKTLKGNLYIEFELEIAEALASHLIQLTTCLDFDNEVGDYLHKVGMDLGEMVIRDETTVTGALDLTHLITKPVKIHQQPAQPKT